MRVSPAWLPVLAATACAGGGPCAAGAHAASAHPWYGPAKIVSIDGPARVTIKSGHRTLSVRLIGVDAPEPGECGAEQSTAALKRIARTHFKRLQFLLQTLKGGGYATDAGGHPLAELAPTNSRGLISGISLGARLIKTGWAREGAPLGADGQADGAGSPASTVGDGDGENLRPPNRGVWAACGGLMHQPGAETIPPTAPSVWSIDQRGIAQAVGPIELSSLSGAAAPTPNEIAGLPGAGPLELVDRDGDCTGYLPTIQLVVTSAGRTGSPTRCGDGPIYLVASYGPGVASADRGLEAGQPAAAAKAVFPLVTDKVLQADAVPLFGERRHIAPWISYAIVGDTGRITGFTAIDFSQAPGIGE